MDSTGEKRLILQEKRDGFHRRKETDSTRREETNPTGEERLILQDRKD